MPGTDLHLVRAKDRPVPGYTLHCIPVKGFLPFHRFSRKLIEIPRMIRRLSPDAVIETAHFGPFGLSPDIKKYTVIHDISPITHPSRHPLPSVLAHKFLLKGIIKRADALIVNSNHTASSLIGYEPASQDKIQIVRPGVPALPEPESRDWLEQKMSLKGPYFLHVGTIEPRKNLPGVVELFENWRNAHPAKAWPLILAGKPGWKYGPVLKRVYDSPYREWIKMPGFVDEKTLSTLYKYASLLLFLSEEEGFGFPILEALATGCKVLAADHPALREVGGPFATYLSQANHYHQSILEEAMAQEQDTTNLKVHLEGFKWDLTGIF